MPFAPHAHGYIRTLDLPDLHSRPRQRRMRTHPLASAARPEPPARRHPQGPPWTIRQLAHLHLALHHPRAGNAHPLLKNFARFARVVFSRPLGTRAVPRPLRQRLYPLDSFHFPERSLTPAQTRGTTLQPLHPPDDASGSRPTRAPDDWA